MMSEGYTIYMDLYTTIIALDALLGVFDPRIAWNIVEK